MNLEIDLSDDLADLESKLLISISQIQKAVSRSLKKTARWLETHSKRELGVALGVPQRVLSARYYQSFNVQGGSRSVGVWFGLNPIRLSHIGKAKQNNIGVKVGSHFYEGAFIATMASGHEGVFKRSAKSNPKNKRVKRADGQWSELPIEEVSFEIDGIASAVLERYHHRAEARFKQILKQEINFALNIETT